MSKSVVLRLTRKSSSAFRPPSLYAPPVTAPPARTSEILGLRLRAERSLLWTIVRPMALLTSPRALAGQMVCGALRHPGIADQQPTCHRAPPSRHGCNQAVSL